MGSIEPDEVSTLSKTTLLPNGAIIFEVVSISTLSDPETGLDGVSIEEIPTSLESRHLGYNSKRREAISTARVRLAVASSTSNASTTPFPSEPVVLPNLYSGDAKIQRKADVTCFATQIPAKTVPQSAPAAVVLPPKEGEVSSR
jgi:hypothetical protein